MRLGRKTRLSFVFMLLALAFMGCKEGMTPCGENSKTADVQLKATLTDMGNANLDQVALSAGSLQIKSALFRIDDFEFEIQQSDAMHHEADDDDDEDEMEGAGENEDEYGEMEDDDEDDDGEDDDGEEMEEDDDDDGDQEGEHEGNHENEDEEGENDEDGEVEIEVEGPFYLDLKSSVIELKSGKVASGILTEYEVTFEPVDKEPMNGHSIIIEGSYASANGKTMPLRIAFKKEFEVESELKQGIKISAESGNSLTFSIDLKSWLATLNLTDLEVSDDIMIIDDDHNKKALVALAKGLGKHISLKMQ
ncbi:hypothetical protein ACFLQJ_00090 [Calditrichota bacterium]